MLAALPAERKVEWRGNVLHDFAVEYGWGMHLILFILDGLTVPADDCKKRKKSYKQTAARDTRSAKMMLGDGRSLMGVFCCNLCYFDIMQRR